ncbi:MAG TPA: imidazole glycerol phosphate synthase subunit HisH [Acidimicrobiales bacterium]|nr:imidazole glycerol phosphate synthase subunit HisH [Acidimicrobiales bacterium]
MIAVLDYGIGNLRSAEKALQRVGGDAHLVSDPDQAMAADAVVLPGVGAFGRCMTALRATGLDKVAVAAVDNGLPFLGICIGLQVLYDGSEEDPGARGLGLIRGTVRALPEGQKHPQMQWNRVQVSGTASGLFAGCAEEPWLYFVHSFAPEPTPEVVATCDYGGPVVAAVEQGPLWATQFHPEKSGEAGLAVLGNFVAAVAAVGAGAAGTR